MATLDKSNYFSRKVVLLNVFATILIVLIHSETPLRFGQPLELSTYPFIYCVLHLATIAVPLFYFISAILFYRNCDWANLPKKLYKRIFSLLIPYLLWNLLFVLIYFTIRKIPILAAKMNMIKSLDTAKDWLLAIWHCRFTPLWFIKYLIFFNLLSPIILLLIKNKWIGITAVIGFIVAGYFLEWSSISLQYNAAIYLGGAMIGKYLYTPGANDSGPILHKKHWYLLIPMYVLFVALYILSIKSYGALYLFKIAGPIIIWFSIDLIIPQYIGSTMKVKPWMGYTFFIYATHQFLLNVEQAVVRSYLPGTPIVLNITFLITPVITLLVIVFIAKYFSKTKVYYVMTGGR